MDRHGHVVTVNSDVKDRVPILRHSTTGLRPADRFDAWHSAMPTGAAPFETTALEPFAMESETLMLGQVPILYVQASAMRWERAAHHLRDGHDDLTVNWRLTGAAAGDSDGRAMRAGVGSLVLGDMARVRHNSSDASRTVMVVLPRALAEARLGPVRDLHGLVIDGALPAMVGAYLQQIRNVAPLLSAADGETLAGTLIDLIGICVVSTGRRVALDENAVEAALKRRARALIDGQIESPTLGIASLCRELAVSRSSLFRLFEAEGGVQTHIRNRRLDHAQTALMDPHNAERIGDIAERLGFSHMAHFSRLFRARFGMTPSEFRAIGQGRA